MNQILSITWDVSPNIFKIGSWGLRWYGVLFIIGFIFGFWMFSKFYKREGVSLDVLDPILWITLICAMIGARLGHVLFYEPDYFLANPSEIIKIWHGGLASHGGAIGVLIAVWWYVKKYGKRGGFDYVWILDRLGVVIPFAGMCIRIGNLMNSEIYGYQTSLPWGFIFVRNGETLPCHPTQLYEAFSYLIIGIILLSIYYIYTKDVTKNKNCQIREKAPYRGFIFGMFLILLFGARFIIEYVKQPQVEGEIDKVLNNGQILSIPFIVGGIMFIIWSFIAKKPLQKKG